MNLYREDNIANFYQIKDRTPYTRICEYSHPISYFGSLYTAWVSTKLSVANPYLRDPEVREKTVTKSVATSSAIEGIRAPFGRGAQTGARGKTHLKRKKS